MDLMCAEKLTQDSCYAMKDLNVLEDERVLQDLLNMEQVYVPDCDYFNNMQTDVKPYMRKIVTKWMLEVSRFYYSSMYETPARAGNASTCVSASVKSTRIFPWSVRSACKKCPDRRHADLLGHRRIMLVHHSWSFTVWVQRSARWVLMFISIYVPYECVIGIWFIWVYTLGINLKTKLVIL